MNKKIEQIRGFKENI